MRISGNTKIVGLFGYPVSHTLSPLIQNAAFREYGLNFVYLPFSIEPSYLEQATMAIRALNITGVNVTIPYKESIVKYLDELSSEAKTIGAVNTVFNSNGKLIGYNTDGKGFIESLKRRGISLQNKQIFLIGAGGVALSISFSLIKEGINRLILTNRTYSKAEDLFNKLKKFAPPTVKLELIEFEKRNFFSEKENIDILINATSLGMHKDDPSPVDLENFSPSTYVYDVVYNEDTQLLKKARGKGMKCQNGVDMLVYQAGFAFEIWTGRKAPIDKMKEIIGRYFKKI